MPEWLIMLLAFGLSLFMLNALWYAQETGRTKFDPGSEPKELTEEEKKNFWTRERKISYILCCIIMPVCLILYSVADLDNWITYVFEKFSHSSFGQFCINIFPYFIILCVANLSVYICNYKNAAKRIDDDKAKSVETYFNRNNILYHIIFSILLLLLYIIAKAP